MGNVKIQYGIGFSQRQGGMYFDLSSRVAEAKALEATVPEIQDPLPIDLNTAPWSPWGADNLLPEQMKADIKNCGILTSIIEGKARFSVCQGMFPAIVEIDGTGQRVIKQFINDPEIIDFLDMNN